MSVELAALLFDMDGTLAETERDGHLAAFNDAFAEHGLPWRWGEALYAELLAVTGGRERMAHYAARHHPGWLDRPQAEEALARVHRTKNRRFAERVADGRVTLRPGLESLLAQARADGLVLGIVTTSSRANVDALLAATLDEPARSAFSLYVTGEDVRRKKPDPECYRLALERLDLPAARVLAIEDSGNGLQAAIGAGLHTLVVRSVWFRDEDFGDAAAVVDSFEGLEIDDLRRMTAAALTQLQKS